MDDPSTPVFVHNHQESYKIKDSKDELHEILEKMKSQLSWVHRLFYGIILCGTKKLKNVNEELD
jgi:hypothetical protein